MCHLFGASPVNWQQSLSPYHRRPCETDVKKDALVGGDSMHCVCAFDWEQHRMEVWCLNGRYTLDMDGSPEAYIDVARHGFWKLYPGLRERAVDLIRCYTLVGNPT